MNKPNTTRRSFLKASLAAGTAAVISGTKGRAKIIGANDRVRIAVAGLNGRGGSHIGGFMGQKNVEIAYLVDPDSRAVARRIDALHERLHVVLLEPNAVPPQQRAKLIVR